MLTNCLFLLLLSAPCVYASARYEKRFEQIFPLSLMGSVMILFLFGLCGILKFGMTVLYVLAALFYCMGVVWIIKGRNVRKFMKKLFTPGAVFFLVSCVLLSVWNYGKLASSWDEFSHWVDVVKASTYVDDFGTNPAAHSTFQSYPPSMMLFQYSLQKLNMLLNPGVDFSEWHAYFAFQVFILSLMLPFFENTSFRQPGKLLMNAAIVFLAPLLFYGNLYSTVYIDPFVGVLFGSGMAMVVLRQKNDWLYRSHICLICATLTLAENAGFVFSSVLAVAFCVDQLMDVKQVRGAKRLPKANHNAAAKAHKDAAQDAHNDVAPDAHKDAAPSAHNDVAPAANKGNDVKAHQEKPVKEIVRYMTVFLAMAAVWLPKMLWSNEIKSAGAQIAFNGKIDWAILLDVILGRDTTYRSELIPLYQDALYSKTIPLGNIMVEINYMGLALVFLCILYLIWCLFKAKQPEQSKRHGVLLGLSGVMLVGYMVGLCVIYMFKFSEYEATRLASMERYLNIVFLGTWLIILLLSANWICLWSTRPESKLILLLVLLLASPTELFGDFVRGDYVRASIEAREPYEQLRQTIEEHCDGNDRIYFISQETTGFDYWVSRYNARPNSFNSNFTWSIGTTFYVGDVWTKKTTPQEWHALLMSQYDYVALYKVNDYFLANYGHLFADPENIETNALYFLNKSTGLLVKCE